MFAYEKLKSLTINLVLFNPAFLLWTIPKEYQVTSLGILVIWKPTLGTLLFSFLKIRNVS